MNEDFYLHELLFHDWKQLSLMTSLIGAATGMRAVALCCPAALGPCLTQLLL